MAFPAEALQPDLPRRRNFAALSAAERARLGAILRPLPWIDGLITALAMVPDEPAGWSDHIWASDRIETVTAEQVSRVTAVIMEHCADVTTALFTRPKRYQPFLGADRIRGAGEWAAGFRFGMKVHPEPWDPLIDDDAARTLLGAILCLERVEDMPEEERADSPFADVPPERLEEMRRSSIEILPNVVRGLLDFGRNLDRLAPYVRGTPKVGRNDPCPCGSGRKYKKCCLAADTDA